MTAFSSPAPYIRGCAWAAGAGVPYPRADPDDFTRLPIDTWGTAQLPVGVRLEFVGDANAVVIAYRTETDDLGLRGDGSGRTFELWRGGECVDTAPAVLGEGEVRLALGDASADEIAVVTLPEGMRPTILGFAVEGGALEPGPAQPRWLAYGDSIAEGWIASSPAGAWPAIAARQFGLDVCNLGYAGSARGEIVSAEQIASCAAEVISISHGTNCWTRIPHSAAVMRAQTAAFLAVVRQGHPETPVVVASPVVRPDAEATPNRLGATLVDLRNAMEEAVYERLDAGDEQLTLVPGAPLLDAGQLADGVHPGDDGHAVLAQVIGGAVAKAVEP
ncbi:MAG: GDSL family lipase [Actinobacteria bacterium]|nr:MAG: GDSL family lipase [Actinomycetota bacterium]